MATSFQPTCFHGAGVRRGFLAAQPLAVGSLIYGITFGVLALGSGLTLAEALAMSLAIYSGTAQIASVAPLTTGASLFAAVATVLLLNARYLLYGAALQPWLSGTRPLQAYGTLYLLGDANWVVSMKARAAGEHDAGFVLGSGLAMFFPWLAGTAAGAFVGGWIPNPKAFALDFFLVAFCMAMLAGMARSRPHLAAAAAALAAALVADRLLPPGWPIVAAGAVGIGVAYAFPPATPKAAAAAGPDARQDSRG